MIRRPPRSTRTDTLFPYTTLFRSAWLRILPPSIANHMLSCNVSRLQMSCLHRLSPHSGRCRVAASAGSYGAIPSRVFASFGKRQEFAYVDHNIGGACNWRFAVERQHGYGQIGRDSCRERVMQYV